MPKVARANNSSIVDDLNKLITWLNKKDKNLESLKQRKNKEVQPNGNVI